MANPLDPVFDPAVLHRVVRGALGRPLPEMIEAIADELSRLYPGHIAPERDWVLNNAGGAMGQLLLLHASITEYLIIFGTPIGTEGHSGRFHAEDHFFILEGEQWAYGQGELERRVYRPGDCHVLPAGEARGYRMPDRCYALEYARGWIPAMMPFGLADALSSTLDLRTVARTFRLYGRAVLRELRQGKV
jgi:C-8 sterol isomerase